MKPSLAPLLLLLAGAAYADREQRSTIVVTLPSDAARAATGRLLVFAEPASAANTGRTAVDIGDPDDLVTWAAQDIAGIGAGGAVTVDVDRIAYPQSFASLRPSRYRAQAFLDVDGSYNFTGRGPGDLVSKVETIDLPLSATPTIALDHALPPAPGQFDVTGLPPRAAEQILASRPHLHDERIASAMLSRFTGRPASIRAWVLTPPGYDPSAPKTYPTVYTAEGFGATHRTDGQQLSRQWHLLETGEIPPMIWVTLDFATPHGTIEFADSARNGPEETVLVNEVLPALEARYRMDAKPSGRFLTGHSSGGWFALWTLVQHPALFGGSWPTAPDPADFHEFLGGDLT